MSRHTGHDRRRRVAVASILLIAASIPVAAPADAHTDLVTSEPREGATLDSWPTAITLEFNESMDPALSDLSLTIEGEVVGALPVEQPASEQSLVAALDDPAVAAISRSDEGSTSWSVVYRVTSVDGH